MFFGRGEYPTKCPFSRPENMEVGHRVGQSVLFFNLVQFGEIEQAKQQIFYWLLDYPDGGKIKKRWNA
jgi:hypothetical protein